MNKKLSLSLLLLSALFIPVFAQPKMTVDQVMEKAIAAMGGRAAFNKLTSTVTKGDVRVPSQGITGNFEIHHKTPNKFVVTQTFGQMGSFTQGFDGKTGWELSPMTGGARKMEGPELEMLKREASFNSFLKWKTLYKKAEMLGLRKVGNQQAYAIRFTPASGKPVTQYYDAKTFLLVKYEMVIEGPMGTVPTETILSNYRTVSGVKMPFAMKQSAAGVEIQMTIKEIKANVAIPDSKFVMPKE